MILQRLCDYYDRIAADPQHRIPKIGFATQQISFCVVLSDNGTLQGIEDIREFNAKTKRNLRISLPYLGTRAGQKIKPMFMWDQPKYLLGWLPKELAKQKREIYKARLSFEASRDLHLSFNRKIDSEGYAVLVRFYEKWNPDSMTEQQSNRLRETIGGFGVFRVVGKQYYIHDEMSVREAWSEFLKENANEKSQCLITGEFSEIADLHPVVKGVSSRSAPLVSFNDDAYTSYGKSKCFNSPVGKIASFKYTNALNYLLEPSRRRRLQIGDTTCVFWADEPSGISEDIFGMGVDLQLQEDESRAEEIVNVFKHAMQGESVLPEPGTGFHVLGLAPNAARISVRFWISGTAVEIVGRVLEHQKRLQIVGGKDDSVWISLRFILAQTTRDPKDIQPLLGGSLLRSVLTGAPYPESLLAAVIRRIRAEQDIRHVKAATIKAILNHNHAKEISVMLDVERPEGAYQLGRLFACLERAQEDALPGLNATIKDRYFGAASSTPASVFPRLIRMNQHHIGKLDGGKKVVAEKRIQEVVGRIDTFPSHFGLVDQGLFAIGYYHQRQDFFTKKDKPAE
ncbi:MAG: type I-C CRISPR-associated protein Cas8c/Csd1 [Rubripirellula sp.]